MRLERARNRQRREKERRERKIQLERPRQEGRRTEKERLVNSQSFPEAVDEGLEEGLVVGDGLQDVPICSDVADGPLAQSRAAQPEDVAVEHPHTHQGLMTTGGDGRRDKIKCPIPAHPHPKQTPGELLCPEFNTKGYVFINKLFIKQLQALQTFVNNILYMPINCIAYSVSVHTICNSIYKRVQHTHTHTGTAYNAVRTHNAWKRLHITGSSSIINMNTPSTHS